MSYFYKKHSLSVHKIKLALLGKNCIFNILVCNNKTAEPRIYLYSNDKLQSKLQIER